MPRSAILFPQFRFDATFAANLGHLCKSVNFSIKTFPPRSTVSSSSCWLRRITTRLLTDSPDCFFSLVAFDLHVYLTFRLIFECTFCSGNDMTWFWNGVKRMNPVQRSYDALLYYSLRTLSRSRPTSACSFISSVLLPVECHVFLCRR